MNETPIPEPLADHGEPWRARFNRISDRMDFRVASMYHETTARRAVTCVNACAGMADPAAELAAMRKAIKEAHAAIRILLAESERNSCQHEETYRGGAIWEICCSCGAKWANDEGGKPEYAEPKSWDMASAAIAKLQPFLK